MCVCVCVCIYVYDTEAVQKPVMEILKKQRQESHMRFMLQYVVVAVCATFSACE